MALLTSSNDYIVLVVVVFIIRIFRHERFRNISCKASKY